MSTSLRSSETTKVVLLGQRLQSLDLVPVKVVDEIDIGLGDNDGRTGSLLGGSPKISTRQI
jgi:hypothetical protein